MALSSVQQNVVPLAEHPISETQQASVAALEAPQSVAVAAIVLPAKQPRRYFDPAKMAQLIESVKRHGLLENFIVRPSATQPLQYELVTGERRYRAAIAVGLTAVPVVVRALDDAQAFALALIENLQREDLSPIEETEGVLALLSLRLQISAKETTALLYRLQHEKKGHIAHNVIGSHQVEQVEAVFAELGKFTWESFVSNRLPLLKLPEALLQLVREGKLAYTKAQAMSRVKDEDFRQQLLQETIEQNLSLGQVRKRIRASLTPNLLASRIPESTLQQAYRRIQSSRVWEDPDKWEKVKALLQELSSLLEA